MYTEFNQYLLLVLTSLNVPNWHLRHSQYFEYDIIMTIALQHHGGGAWHNTLFLVTVSNINSGTDLATNFHSNETKVWQAPSDET